MEYYTIISLFSADILKFGYIALILKGLTYTFKYVKE